MFLCKFKMLSAYIHLLLFLYLITELNPARAVSLLYECGFNFKSKWSLLTSFLSVPLELKGKMRAIIKEDETYEYAIEIALDWWIKNTSEASWKDLISSVDRCEEKDTADAMKKKLSKEGMSYNHRLLTIITFLTHCAGDKFNVQW